MASALPTTASSLPKSAVAANLPLYTRFPVSSFGPKLRFPSKGLRHTWKRSTVVKAQPSEVRTSPWLFLAGLFSKLDSFVDSLLEPSVALKVASGGSSNAAAISASKSGLPLDSKDPQPSAPSSVSEEAISEFLSQVSSLVKLVDSKDIVELQLKQLDCEIVIRKKEALPQPPSPPLPMMIHSPALAFPPAAPAVPSPAPAAVPSSAPTSSPLQAAPKSADSSLPPLKCPMAGTFYRSPAPGEPPFVKKGDKVQKGQVICIIEAMKLMNEIEADQSGTIVDIVAEDGKPVSVDTPLFVIKP